MSHIFKAQSKKRFDGQTWVANHLLYSRNYSVPSFVKSILSGDSNSFFHCVCHIKYKYKNNQNFINMSWHITGPYDWMGDRFVQRTNGMRECSSEICIIKKMWILFYSRWSEQVPIPVLQVTFPSLHKNPIDPHGHKTRFTSPLPSPFTISHSQRVSISFPLLLHHYLWLHVFLLWALQELSSKQQTCNRILSHHPFSSIENRYSFLVQFIFPLFNSTFLFTPSLYLCSICESEFSIILSSLGSESSVWKLFISVLSLSISFPPFYYHPRVCVLLALSLPDTEKVNYFLRL